jgi:HEAT repeat protein
MDPESAFLTLEWLRQRSAGDGGSELSESGGKPAAVRLESLVALLGNAESATRIEAARALGRLGDPRAVDPLCRALTAAVGGQTPRQLRKHGKRAATVVGACVAAWLGFGLLSLTSADVLAAFLAYPYLFLIATSLIALYHIRVPEQGEELVAIMRALAQVAAQAPWAAQSRLVPDLEAIADDWLQHSRSTRTAARAAVEQIRTHVGESAALPVPVVTAVEVPDNLPVPTRGGFVGTACDEDPAPRE